MTERETERNAETKRIERQTEGQLKSVIMRESYSDVSAREEKCIMAKCLPSLFTRFLTFTRHQHTRKGREAS